MTRHRALPAAIAAIIVVAVAVEAGAQPAAGFAFQGQLRGPSGPVDGPCRLRFGLWSAAIGGTRVGPLIEQELMVRGGLLLTRIDFGGGAFDGTARFLETAVSCPPEDPPVTLPRQPLTPTPYAISAPWPGVSGVPAGFDDGTDDDALGALACGPDGIPRSASGWQCSEASAAVGAPAGSGLAVTGAIDRMVSTDPSIVQRRIVGACPPGESIRSIGEDGAATCAPDSEADIEAVVAGDGLAGGASAGDAVLTIDPAVIQRRIVSGCPPGERIRAVAVDGSVVCEVDDANPLQLEVQTVSCTDSVASGTAGCAVPCPAGFLATGGGCEVSGTARILINHAADAFQWRCVCRSASGAEFASCTATAVCARAR